MCKTPYHVFKSNFSILTFYHDNVTSIAFRHINLIFGKSLLLAYVMDNPVLAISVYWLTLITNGQWQLPCRAPGYGINGVKDLHETVK